MSVAIIRCLALGLVGGLPFVPLLWLQRGDGFGHTSLAALMALVVAQVVTVPIGLVTGIVLSVTKLARTPGYVLGWITMVFGVLVTGLSFATENWARGRPSGIGDPDGEGGIAMLAMLSGAFTIAIALIIFVVRSVPELSQSPPVRSRNAPPRP
ncbi:hypothetical protein ACTWPT_32870 [Nonomuraea sp. 3N208]|uniref:hypothetical protein n=1 Tax=Nonomuraea sp. 3N208 TaxID=3457421 RepID=UPI003FD46068